MEKKTVIRIEVNGHIPDSALFGKVVTSVKEVKSNAEKVLMPFTGYAPVYAIVQLSETGNEAFRILSKTGDESQLDTLEIQIEGEASKEVIQHILYRAKETLYNMHWHGRRISATEVTLRNQHLA